MYRAWRQGWLERQAKQLDVIAGREGGEAFHLCAICSAVGDRIVKVQGLWQYEKNLLTVGHKRGRFSHAEDKMSDDGVQPECWRCNGAKAGQRNVLPRPN